MVITVDRERCASSGQCALAAPEVFTQDEEDGRVVLLDENATGPEVRRAITGCPTQAIRST
ncbi:ferredoxin [Nonomuraea africana]|uniref:Ferredoxin n=1 Tax=Nonomuraea africana TaxID=46171 RepID=A0ABR9KC63_9ACTN|nr:ferredoxin [Nonomuraea africana]MBE1559593.1 ferredoxin [Nonomuraea africana]